MTEPGVALSPRLGVTLSVFAAAAPNKIAVHHCWIALDAIEAIALAAPHKRAILRLVASLN